MQRPVPGLRGRYCEFAKFIGVRIISRRRIAYLELVNNLLPKNMTVMIEDNKLLELAEKIERLSNIGRIYNANIIEELHANENAHSRVLRMFLQYDDGSNQYPILKRFLDIPKIRDIISDLEFDRPQFTNEQERIDLLIEDRAVKFAIIVENKICGASDQDRQLERYIESVKYHGIKESKIYAIYLTRDGEKTIDDKSFTSAAKKALDYNADNNGRFIELNYKNDILPWLENCVLPNCTLKENLLVSALTQYIDFLKTIFELNKNNRQKGMIMSEIKKELGLENIQDCANAIERLDSLSENISNLRDEMAMKIGVEYIQEPFKRFLEKKEVPYNIKCEFSYSYICLNVFSDNWERDRFYFRINYENPMIYGIVNYDINTPSNVDITRFKEKGFNKSNWWPAWKRFTRTDLRYPNTPEFWTKVKSGDFEKYLEEIFDECLDLLISK